MEDNTKIIIFTTLISRGNQYFERIINEMELKHKKPLCKVHSKYGNSAIFENGCSIKVICIDDGTCGETCNIAYIDNDISDIVIDEIIKPCIKIRKNTNDGIIYFTPICSQEVHKNGLSYEELEIRIKNLEKDIESLKNQNEYLRSNEYLKQVIFERNYLQQRVEDLKMLEDYYSCAFESKNLSILFDNYAFTDDKYLSKDAIRLKKELLSILNKYKERIK